MEPTGTAQDYDRITELGNELTSLMRRFTADEYGENAQVVLAARRIEVGVIQFRRCVTRPES